LYYYTVDLEQGAPKEALYCWCNHICTAASTGAQNYSSFLCSCSSIGLQSTRMSVAVQFYETLRFLPQYYSKWRLRIQRVTPHPPPHLHHLSYIPRAGIWPLLPACSAPASVCVCVCVCMCVCVATIASKYARLRSERASARARARERSREREIERICSRAQTHEAHAHTNTHTKIHKMLAYPCVRAHRIRLQADDFLSACLFLLSAVCHML
jgi:hypothetical protein